MTCYCLTRLRQAFIFHQWRWVNTWNTPCVDTAAASWLGRSCLSSSPSPCSSSKPGTSVWVRRWEGTEQQQQHLESSGGCTLANRVLPRAILFHRTVLHIFPPSILSSSSLLFQPDSAASALVFWSCSGRASNWFYPTAWQGWQQSTTYHLSYHPKREVRHLQLFPFTLPALGGGEKREEWEKRVQIVPVFHPLYMQIHSKLLPLIQKYSPSK